MDIFYNILNIVIVLGILILIHEFGHFIAARLTHTRAEVFSFGMGPRLFGYNKVNGFSFWKLPKDFDSGDHTDYRVAMFLVGGYVKVSGMVDESMDAEFAKSEEIKPYEFRAKNTLQKAFILSAGVIMNILLAVVFFAGIIFSEGQYIAKTTTVGYVIKESVAGEIGLKAKDKIISINGKKLNTWDECLNSLVLKDLGESRTILIRRDGRDTTLKTDGAKIINSLAEASKNKLVSLDEVLGIYPDQVVVYLISVSSRKPAGLAGMEPGDTILSVAGAPIHSVSQLQQLIRNHLEIPVKIDWKRKNETFSKWVTPENSGTIGIGIMDAYTGPKLHKEFDIFESIGYGFAETYRTASLFIGSIVQIIKGNISFKQSIGGPVQIAEKATQSAKMGIAYFFNFMALLSVTLALINILPFPALDGGHLVFVLIEGIIRREISIKIKMAFQQFGIAVLLILMAFVIYNDITR